MPESIVIVPASIEIYVIERDRLTELPLQLGPEDLRRPVVRCCTVVVSIKNENLLGIDGLRQQVRARQYQQDRRDDQHTQFEKKLCHWAILRRVPPDRNRASSVPQQTNTSSFRENGNARPQISAAQPRKNTDMSISPDWIDLSLPKWPAQSKVEFHGKGYER